MRPGRRGQRPERVALVVLLVAGSAAHAQDSHYWSNQYGSVSELLGGAVVGSVRDLSATYYNPGALGFLEESGAMVTADVVQWTDTRLKDGGGSGIDLGSDRFNRAPTFAASMARADWLGDYRLAYSALTRQKYDVRIDERRESIGDVFGLPDLDTFVGDLRASVDLKETWVGLTLARRVGSQVAVGLSQYLALRSHKASLSTSAQAIGSTGEGAAALFLNDFKYKDLRILWKVGVAVDGDRWKAGFALTSPSVAVYGTGSATDNVTVVGLDLDGDGTNDPVIASDFQEGLSAEYRSPFAFAAGLAYGVGATEMHASAEWFAPVDEYEVVDTEPYVAQTSGEVLRNRVKSELDDVLNLGIGLEQHFGERWSGFASFATDFSGATTRVLGEDISATRWDLYHVATGIRRKAEKRGFILGVSWAFGDTRTAQLVDFTDPDESNRLVGTLADAELRFTRIKLLFGVDFLF